MGILRYGNINCCFVVLLVFDSFGDGKGTSELLIFLLIFANKIYKSIPVKGSLTLFMSWVGFLTVIHTLVEVLFCLYLGFLV